MANPPAVRETDLRHGSKLALPSWATSALADQWTDGSWRSEKALAIVADAGRLEDVQLVAMQLEQACRPCEPGALANRLTLLGMTMSPNRAPAETKAWLHEFARLLGDLPADILFSALDTLQKRLKFLPTVAEIRELADAEMEKRRRLRGRAEAMARYLESGAPIPKLAHPEPQMPKADEPITPQEAERLNAMLERAGASTRYRGDGSTYEIEQQKQGKRQRGPRRKPTRADYIEMGVDPAVLDRLETESQQAETG